MDEPALIRMYAAEQSFANELADIAADIAVSYPAHALQVRSKDDLSPVTAADAAIERALRAAVAGRFPRDGFLGEEEGASRDGKRMWVVDPIDGTRNFIDGIQIWAVLIALVVDDRPVLGIIDSPGLRERYEAVRGQGARMNGVPIGVSTAKSVGEALVVHSGVEEWLAGPYWEGFERIAMKCRRTRGLSDFWGHMLVARGSADVLMEHEPCGLWDWAAVSVILEEAGGRITTLDGEEPHGGCSLLSTNGALHDEVLGLLHGERAGK